MSNPARVIVFDTTLRDGEQAPGFSLDVPAKLAMARALDTLGVDIIEAGFPIASPADAEAVRQIAVSVRRPVIAALARTRPQDIEEAGGARAPPQPATSAPSSGSPARSVSNLRSPASGSQSSSPTMWSFRRRTRPEAIAISCAA